MRANRVVLTGTLALIVAVAAPAAAQGPSVEILAGGLKAPRGLAIASDGSVYVAEAGTAGDTCSTDIPGRGRVCFGLSGAVTRIREGSAERIVEGLPSISAGPDAGGPSDIALIDDDSFYVIVNLAGHPADRDGMPDGIGDVAGWLLKASTDGSFEPFADIASYEATANPDAEHSSGEVYSNPHSVAVTEDGVAVVDAGGNSLLQVSESGEISLIAVIPPLLLDYVPDQGVVATDSESVPTTDVIQAITIPVQAVPTSVAVGPDGALYLGQLVGGPYQVGEASVWRVVPGQEPERYASGFTNIIDIAFGPDGTLYVAELATEGLAAVFEGDTTPVGAVLAIPPHGGEPEMVISDSRIIAPGGIAVDAAGAIYVSTGTLTPGGGSVVRISPYEPAPPGEAVVLEIGSTADKPIAFTASRLEAQAGQAVTVRYSNDSSVPHNIAFFDSPDASGSEIVDSEIITGPGAVTEVTFTAPDTPGEYFFLCEIHPLQMTGTLTVLP